MTPMTISLRRRSILWMKILTNCMMRWKKEASPSGRSGLRANFCYRMKRHSPRLWPYRRRWRVRRRRSWMQVQYPTAGVDLYLHLLLITPSVSRSKDTPILETWIEPFHRQWRPRGTNQIFMVSSPVPLRIIVLNLSLRISKLQIILTLANTTNLITTCFLTFSRPSNPKWEWQLTAACTHQVKVFIHSKLMNHSSLFSILKLLRGTNSISNNISSNRTKRIRYSIPVPLEQEAVANKCSSRTRAYKVIATDHHRHRWAPVVQLHILGPGNSTNSMEVITPINSLSNSSPSSSEKWQRALWHSWVGTWFQGRRRRGMRRVPSSSEDKPQALKGDCKSNRSQIAKLIYQVIRNLLFVSFLILLDNYSRRLTKSVFFCFKLNFFFLEVYLIILARYFWKISCFH